MPADGLEAQDVVPPHCGCWVARMAIFVAAHFSQAAFPAFFAGAGRPLLPSMIDYSVFSRSAAARGSIISGPVSRSATAFNFCIQGQIRLTRHLVIGSQGRTAITPPAVLIAVREYMLSSSRYMVRYAACPCPPGMTRPPRVLSYER